MNRILSTSLLFCAGLSLASCQGEPIVRGDRQPPQRQQPTTIGGGTGDLKIPNEANINYEEYTNERFDFSLLYPKDIVSPEAPPKNNDGLTFASPNENVVMKAFGYNNIQGDTIEDLYREALAQEGRNVTYRIREDNWFVISGYEGDRVFYIKKTMADNNVLTLDVEYDRSLQNEFDPVVATVSDSFQTVADSSYPVSVFFPVRGGSFEEVEAVSRTSPDLGVAEFAMQELIDGPTAAEQQRGLIDPIDFQGASNCQSNQDFNIAINEGTARLKFCRTVPLGGVGDIARTKTAIEETLTQFSTVSDVVMLDKYGDCFQDLSGQNQCLSDNAGVQLSQSCHNDAIGYTVGYPGGWETNSGEILNTCQVFDPTDASLPARSDSFDEAVYLREENMSFDRVAGAPYGAEASRELSRRSLQIDGHQAVVIEEESTGIALLPEGVKTYRYVVDLDGSTLVGATYSVEGQNYDRNKQVLDRMMSDLKFDS